MPNEMLVEGNRPGDFLYSEPDPLMSREQITVTGGKFPAGAVLSLVAGKYTEPDAEAEAHAVLLYPRDASIDDQTSAAVVRLAALKADHLEWPDDITAADKAAIIATMKGQMLILRGA